MIKGNCLSKDEMIRFQRNELSGEQSRDVEEHLQSCEFCREALEGVRNFLEHHSIGELEATLAVLDQEMKTLTEGKDKILKKPSKPNGNWFFPGILILVVVVLSLFIYFLFLKREKEKPVVEAYPALQGTYKKPVQDTSVKPVAQPEPAKNKNEPVRSQAPLQKDKKQPEDSVQKKVVVTGSSTSDRKESKGDVWEESFPMPESKEAPKEIFTVVEEQPEFPGGDDARVEFIIKNIRYPQQAVEHGIQGKVFVTFVVETDGTLSDIRVLRGIGGGCDEEAIRIIKAMPKWIPGKQRGRAVKVQYNLPVKFTLP